jgi:GTP-binding protein
MIFTSAITGKRVEKILDLVDTAFEQHQRRVPTAVINEVLQDAVNWHSPPTSRGGRQGKIYYGTQVKSQPPTIALFVNDPTRFNDNYRRYVERQFRQQLGFTGTPLRLLWRGKKVREVGDAHISANRATRV